MTGIPEFRTKEELFRHVAMLATQDGPASKLGLGVTVNRTPDRKLTVTFHGDADLLKATDTALE